MKFTMKAPAKRMKNSLKEVGNGYEIDNDIPKFQE